MYLIFMFFQNLKVSLSDVAELGQLGFQDPASPAAEGLINLHDEIFFYIVVICIFVFSLLFVIIFLFDETKQTKPDRFVHGTMIEVIWTILPALVLLSIAIPSFSLLYSLVAFVVYCFLCKNLNFF